MAINNTEANALMKVLRYFLEQNGKPGPVTEEVAREAAELLIGKAYKTLHAGLAPEQVYELWANRTDKNATEKRFGDAIDWLLNSRYTDSEAVTAFWGICDGRWTADDAEHGSIDGVPLRDIPQPGDK
jgi:hypothetical protein